MRYVATLFLPVTLLLGTLPACRTGDAETPGLLNRQIDLTGDWTIPAADILQGCGGVTIETISGRFRFQQTGDSLLLGRWSGSIPCSPLAPWGTGSVDGTLVTFYSTRIIPVDEGCSYTVNETDVATLLSIDTISGSAIVEATPVGDCATKVSCGFQNSFTATRIDFGLFPEMACIRGPL